MRMCIFTHSKTTNAFKCLFQVGLKSLSKSIKTVFERLFQVDLKLQIDQNTMKRSTETSNKSGTQSIKINFMRLKNVTLEEAQELLGS